MLEVILALLVIFYLLGYVPIPFVSLPDLTLFSINNYPVTLWNLLIFLGIISLIGILPSPIREIVFVILIIWAISVLGIISITGLSNILVLVLIVGLIGFVLTGV
jgi:hypothetical protein